MTKLTRESVIAVRIFHKPPSAAEPEIGDDTGGLTNEGLWVKPYSLYIFINKVLLNRSTIRCFTYVLWLLLYKIVAELPNGNGAHTALNS